MTLHENIGPRSPHNAAVLTLDVLGELQVQMLDAAPLSIPDTDVMLDAWGRLRRTLQPPTNPDNTDRTEPQ